MINVYTDGGARGNPGPAAIGVFIVHGKNAVLARIGKKIGHATNNVAEYTAVIEGLAWIAKNIDKLSIDRINFFLDSQLVVSQLNGIYKIKNSVLRELLFSIREKEASLGSVISYTHIRREKNKEADRLVNMALDNTSSISLE